mmetsp:Transcript_20878/g.53863  ORF Transcript_20878/g.53863 Transcript_20878/m.53863 type:complete len:200 (-) Transcript_20878:520-1119(-)
MGSQEPRARCATLASRSRSPRATTPRAPTRSPSSTSPASATALSKTCLCSSCSWPRPRRSSCRCAWAAGSATSSTPRGQSTRHWPSLLPTSAQARTRCQSARRRFRRQRSTGHAAVGRRPQVPSHRASRPSRTCTAGRLSSSPSIRGACGSQTRARRALTRRPACASHRVRAGRRASATAGTSAPSRAGARAPTLTCSS